MKTETGEPATGEPAWLHGHPHEPNSAPPGVDATFQLELPGGVAHLFAPDDLAQLPQTTVDNCYIVSTGHGASGPFTFGGVRLVDFLGAHLPPHLPWRAVDVISGDGFGNRVAANELAAPVERPILLATHIDGVPMTREAGLVRMIVPNEVDDALRQVKWVARILVYED